MDAIEKQDGGIECIDPFLGRDSSVSSLSKEYGGERLKGVRGHGAPAPRGWMGHEACVEVIKSPFLRHEALAAQKLLCRGADHLEPTRPRPPGEGHACSG